MGLCTHLCTAFDKSLCPNDVLNFDVPWFAQVRIHLVSGGKKKITSHFTFFPITGLVGWAFLVSLLVHVHPGWFRDLRWSWRQWLPPKSGDCWILAAFFREELSFSSLLSGGGPEWVGGFELRADNYSVKLEPEFVRSFASVCVDKILLFMAGTFSFSLLLLLLLSYVRT